MFGWIYDLCLHFYILASLPKIFTHWSKYKRIFKKRLGFGFPQIEKKDRSLIWIHAVSLGETKAVAPLIKKFKALPKPPLILLSTATETGHQEGLKNVPQADFHLLFPLDLSYLIRPIVKRVKPDVVVITETDFWYHFQESAKRQGALLCVVNGKISERTFKRLSKMPFLTKRLLQPIDHFYLQSDLYRERFEKLGLPAAKLTVTGNIKLDTEVIYTDEAKLKEKLGVGQEPILTLGSTHNPEESLWISAIKQLWKEFPSLKILIVPRHPERFSEVAKLLESESIPYGRWSQDAKLSEHPVLLVDAMGVLRSCYQISTLAFVGGSFTPKIGGHNILEPAFYGKPVLFGPYMYSQPDLLALVNAHKAGLQIIPADIVPTVKELLLNQPFAQQLGTNGFHLTQMARGCLERTFNLLQKELPC